MKPIITRVRILRTRYGFKPQYRGIVMHGAKCVALTANVADLAACQALAETLEATYRVAQRSAQ